MTILLQDTALILISSMLLSLFFMAFNQPPLLGYILAGTCIGPAFAQVVENTHTLHILGEIGLILLLFLVGLEISLDEFKKVWKQTLAFLFVQLTFCVLAAFICTKLLGLSNGISIVIAFILTLSSTAVVITLLENMNILHSKTGSFAVSVLIAQDLSLMPMILIIRSFGSESSGISSFLTLLLALGLLIFAVLHFGKQPDETKTKLYYKSLLRRPEITTLIGASVCFTFAALADMINLSAAYGAFLAGLMLGNRWDRELLTKAFIPITSMMMMVFFISVGLRVSLNFMWSNIWPIVAALCVSIIGKMGINTIGLLAIKWPVRSTVFVAGLLAQMSEFSFVLIEEADKSKILSHYHSDFLVCLATLSLAIGSSLPILVRMLQDKSVKNKDMA